jgi:putative DNA primase/helicase
MPMPADDIHGFDGSFEAARQQLGTTRRHAPRLPLSILSARLDTDDRGRVLPTLANAMAILTYDPALAGCLGYDEFRGQPFLLRPPPVANSGDAEAPGPYPRAWVRSDVALITAHIQRAHCPRMRREVVEDAMEAEAARNRYHPVRAYLASLEWDGKPRLTTWLVDAFGADANPYTAAIGAKILIAAVRRVRQPGVKFDHVPVAQGAQGLGKSSTWAALCGPEWFSDNLPDELSDKDAAMALRGVWFLEMAELTQLLASEAEAVKAFVSRPVDRYRPPYGRQVIEVPRQGILVGTTNAEEWLRDATGNRRFWPFDCKKADAAWVRENRDQLWAEAAAREAAGEPHWLDDPDALDEAREMQNDRMVEDPWHDAIRLWLVGRIQATAPEILEHAIQMPKAQQNRGAQMRVTAILTRLGWKPKRSKRERWWEPPSDDIG